MPEQSSVIVKKNRVLLRLKKAGQWDHWVDLIAKKPRAKDAAGKAIPADPSAGIMDLMKDMYNDGDDQTRKMIAEAWTKSREKGGAAGAGFGGGMGGIGGVGGGDGLDDDI